MANSLTPKEEFLLNPVTEHNITDAAIASFETNLRHGVKVEVPFEPKQDLHGYDYPWPAGGGGNLLKLEDQEITRYAEITLEQPISIVSGKYTLSVETTTTDVDTGLTSIIFRGSSGYNYSFSSLTTGERTSMTINFDRGDDTLVKIRFFASSGGISQGDGDVATFKNIKLEAGEIATPYSNICPIEGWTGANIYRASNNILMPKDDNDYYPTFIKAGIQVTASVLSPSDNDTVRFYRQDKTQVTYLFLQGAADAEGYKKRSYTASEDIYYIKFDGNYSNYQVNFGDVRLPYNEPSATSLPISWKHAEGTYEFSPVQEGSGDPSPENVRPIHPGLTITRDDNTELTVYGGSITFNDDGTSRVDEVLASITVSNVNNSSYNNYNASESTARDFNLIYPCMHYIHTFELTNSISNYLVDTHASFWNSVTLVNRYGIPIESSRKEQHDALGIRLPNELIGVDGTETATERTTKFNAYLAAHPAQIVYTLATPVSYTLSITETQRTIEALGDKVTTTIYGGTVTVNEDGSADVVDTHKYVEYDGVNNAFIYSVGTAYRATFSASEKGVNTGNTPSDKLYCNSYNPVQTAQAGNCYVSGGGSFFFVYPTTAYESLEDFNASLASNPIIIAYQLATPITYHFYNVGKLKAFLGTNNIWSDIGNVNVKYLTQNSETGMEYRGDRALELRRRAMIADAPTIHTTIGSSDTGGLASFKSYVKAPVKKIEIPFEPKQDLHGYDYPWPAGGGKNLLNATDIYDDETSAYIPASSSVLRIKLAISNGTYTISTNDAGTGSYANVFAGDSTWYDRTMATSDNGVTSTAPRTITVSDGYIVIGVRGNDSAGGRIITRDMLANGTVTVQLESGSTATAYEPYENICPIEGHDGCEIEHRYINLFPTSVPNNTISAKFGTVNVATGTGTVFTIPCLKNTSYACINPNKIHIEMAFADTHPFVGMPIYTRRNMSLADFWYVNSDEHNYLIIYLPSGITLDTLIANEIMLYAGTERKSYEYPKGTTLPLIFNQAGDHAFLPIQDGTGDPSPENERPIHPGLVITRDDESTLEVYGGTLTVNEDGTGSISSEYIRRNAQSSWVFGKQSTTGWYMTLSDMPSGYQNSKSYCNVLTKVDSQSSTEFGVVFGYSGANRLVITGSQPTYSTTADLSAYLTEIGACFVYPAATPTIYTLSVAETNRALEALGLSQHIGTIYGGTVAVNEDGSADVVSELRFDTKSSSDIALRILNSGSSGYNIYRLRMPVEYGNVLISNQYKQYPSVNDATAAGGGIAIGNKTGSNLYISVVFPWVSGDTNETADARLLANTLQIGYTLATPQTYHFSNLEQLKVWLGENNFWCDISDDISVKYWNRGFGN